MVECPWEKREWQKYMKFEGDGGSGKKCKWSEKKLSGFSLGMLFEVAYDVAVCVTYCPSLDWIFIFKRVLNSLRTKK